MVALMKLYKKETAKKKLVCSYWIVYAHKKEKKHDRGGIRTHAIEMTGALNQRLRPLGHPAIWQPEC